MQYNKQSFFINSDLLTTILKKRFRLSNWLATLVVVLAMNIPIIVDAFIENLWLNKPNQVGLLKDYNWWILQFLSIPATVFYLLWIPEGIQDVLMGLLDNKAIILSSSNSDDKSRFSDFVRRFERCYFHWGWVAFCFIASMIFQLFISAPVQRTFKTWQTGGGEFIFWYTVFFWIIVFFFTTLLVIRVIVTIVWFNRLFREFEINVKVLHPDGAGGLSPIGLFSTRLGYLIGIYGLIALSSLFAESYVSTTRYSGLLFTPAIVPPLIAYLILSPVTFFAPIGTAHWAMKLAKNKFILKIANQFEVESNKVETMLDSKSAELKQSVEKIEQLQKLHRIASAFPVWPFNADNLIRFFSIILSPVVLGIISILLDLVK